MTKKYETYIIVFPNSAFYIGYTAVTLPKRLERHFSEQYRRERRAVVNYADLHGWTSADMQMIKTGEYTTEKEAKGYEVQAIAKYWFDPRMLNRGVREYRSYFAW